MAEKYEVFTRYRLKPERVDIPAGSGPSIEALLSGTVDITSIDWVSVLKLAESRGIYLKAVHNWLIMGSYKGGTSDPSHGSALVVKSDSNIQRLEQLKGKRVAVNALNALPHMALSILLTRVGLNPAKDVEWVEIPFLRMAAPLAAGQVDGAVMVEPFMTAVVKQGIGRPLTDPPTLPYPNLYIAAIGNPLFVTGYFTSEQTWHNKRTTIQNAASALADGIRYMYGDLEETIKHTAAELNMSEDIIKEALPGVFFVAEPNRFREHRMLENQIEALTKIGFHQKPVDTS
ncbi:MAG: ABC transporter substrate-binding protein, partial [Candidatus Caldarchaeum sp.]|nr:ABC transporter substrate-binding protein [Candidatus Caldarchaeum sp.]MDW8435679.1 ABC transporter substrate-binding protein [Candidatus Caldarchaeum sp.]